MRQEVAQRGNEGCLVRRTRHVAARAGKARLSSSVAMRHVAALTATQADEADEATGSRERAAA